MSFCVAINNTQLLELYFFWERCHAVWSLLTRYNPAVPNLAMSGSQRPITPNPTGCSHTAQNKLTIIGDSKRPSHRVKQPRSRSVNSMQLVHVATRCVSGTLQRCLRLDRARDSHQPHLIS